MKSTRRVSRLVYCATAALLCAQVPAFAQRSLPVSRVTTEVRDEATVQLRGNVHPFTRVQRDDGALPDSQPMQRMLLLLQRSPEQETALQQLMDAQQTKGSGSYHAWLTPDQFGKQFGPSDADLQAVTDWLTKHGFQVAKVSAGRTTIEFSGNVAQVRSAFHTEIHRFAAEGKIHFANVNDPQIPAALAPVVRGVVALHNFPKTPHILNKGTYRRNVLTGELRPMFTFGTPANFALGPADFATIYNIPAGADGTGQSIAIVGQSNINIQDVRAFRTMFGLPANDPKIIVNGPDPGLVAGDEGESDLDVEWAGAIAPAAQILFVASQSTISNPTQVSAGIDLSALYIVDNNLAPVMSESYGACEAGLGQTGNAFYSLLWQQAAAQGMTVAISTGDNGSAGCDPDLNGPNPDTAIHGVQVSGFASTPYNVAVGGTDFDPSTTTPTSTYWNTTSGTVSSALKYMPETTWNDSTCAINYPTPCTTVDPQGFDVVGGSGGPSNCLLSSIDSNDVISCATNGTFPNGGYVKPPWQTSVTPADGVRDQPDISFFASNGQNGVGLVICESDSNPAGAPCNLDAPYQDFSLVGGTSASTPAFAAVMALVNQKTGQRQGNANFVLYGLAASDANYKSGKCNSSLGATPVATCVFNDVTKGNNSVACFAGSPNCNNTTGGFGVLTYPKDNGTPAFQAVAGYDLATGLGSIDVANLLNAWSSFSRTATATTLSSPSGATNVSGLPFSVTVSVAPAGSTGDVSLIATSPSGQAGLGPFTLSGGSVQASTNLLPPGTTTITAYYEGDATHAASTSAPLALNVVGSGQASKTVLSWIGFDANNNPIPSTSSQNVPYGTPYILQIAVANSGGATCTSSSGGSLTTPATPCPTGNVTLTDNGSALKDYPNGATPNATNVAKLNNLGIAEDQPIQLSPGSHSIAASYAGDPNYSASTSNTLSVTITQAATQTGIATSLSSVTSGTNVTFTVYELTVSNGAGPTGTVQLSNGTTSLGAAVTCKPTSGAQNTTPPVAQITPGTAYCVATMTAAISSIYPPPQTEPQFPGMPLVMGALCVVLYLAALRLVPAAKRHAYAYAGLLALALLAVGFAGCGGGGGSSGGGGGNTRTINAAYSGDANYTASSGSVAIVVQ